MKNPNYLKNLKKLGGGKLGLGNSLFEIFKFRTGIIGTGILTITYDDDSIDLLYCSIWCFKTNGVFEVSKIIDIFFEDGIYYSDIESLDTNFNALNLHYKEALKEITNWTDCYFKGIPPRTII